MSDVHCRACGAELPDEPRDLAAESREPCPSCGSRDRALTVSLEMFASSASAASLDLAVAAVNTSQTRVLHLREELGRLEALTQTRDAAGMNRVASNMLDILHELNDDSRRGEWSPVGWDEDTIALWHGLMGVRNVVHHNRAYVVTLHGSWKPDENLRWDVQQESLGKVSGEQRVGYERHMHGHAVVPQLVEITALLEQTVSGA